MTTHHGAQTPKVERLRDLVNHLMNRLLHRDWWAGLMLGSHGLASVLALDSVEFVIQAGHRSLSVDVAFGEVGA